MGTGAREADLAILKPGQQRGGGVRAVAILRGKTWPRSPVSLVTSAWERTVSLNNVGWPIVCISKGQTYGRLA